MLGLIAKGLNAFVAFMSWLSGAEQRKAGRQEQQVADQAATLKTVQAERTAVEQAGSAEDAAKRGDF